MPSYFSYYKTPRISLRNYGREGHAESRLSEWFVEKAMSLWPWLLSKKSPAFRGIFPSKLVDYFFVFDRLWIGILGLLRHLSWTKYFPFHSDDLWLRMNFCYYWFYHWVFSGLTFIVPNSVSIAGFIKSFADFLYTDRRRQAITPRLLPNRCEFFSGEIDQPVLHLKPLEPFRSVILFLVKFKNIYGPTNSVTSWVSLFYYIRCKRSEATFIP